MKLFSWSCSIAKPVNGNNPVYISTKTASVTVTVSASTGATLLTAFHAHGCNLLRFSVRIERKCSVKNCNAQLEAMNSCRKCLVSLPERAFKRELLPRIYETK